MDSGPWACPLTTRGAGSNDAESIRTIHRALDLGIDFIDTAELYGPYTNDGYGKDAA